MGKFEITIGLPPGLRSWVNRYALRIIVKLGGHRQLMDERRVHDPELLAELGVECPAPATPHRPDLLLIRLRNRLKIYERGELALPADLPFTINLQWIVQTLGLAQVEEEILQFLAVLHHAHLVRDLLDNFKVVGLHEVHTALAVILNRTPVEVAGALSPDSKLLKSGLVWLDLSEKWGFRNMIQLLEGVANQLTVAQDDPSTMFRSNFLRRGHGSLKIEDYPHLKVDLGILIPYLRSCLHERRKGVNILLVGPPGTGKTELVHALAAEVGSPLFGVATANCYGFVLESKARFGAFQLAQGLLGGDPPPLLLFDEADDVLNQGEEGFLTESRRRTTGRKAWINEQLQENPVPTFWVCNSTRGFEASFLRRFDFIVKMDVPPRSVRLRILQRHTQGLSLRHSWLQQMARHEHLSPAAIERAAKVTGAAKTVAPEVQAEEVMDRLLGNALDAMGVSRAPLGLVTSEMTYRPDLLNADRDLHRILHGVSRSGSVRMALYGPPGTGKTAFAHYLAEVVDKPLIVKRASDLQSKWVGETEKALAAMFDEAVQEDAVLLVDEVDSLLADRQGTQRSWEVSQINELLTQMEGFRGVFIAATNRLEHLDSAALRRFDLKIHFDFLTVEQRVALFGDCLNALGLQASREAVEVVTHLSRLTPGDFNVVMRQQGLDPIISPVDFAERLVQEVQLKPGVSKRQVGFK